MQEKVVMLKGHAVRVSGYKGYNALASRVEFYLDGVSEKADVDDTATWDEFLADVELEFSYKTPVTFLDDENERIARGKKVYRDKCLKRHTYEGSRYHKQNPSKRDWNLTARHNHDLIAEIDEVEPDWNWNGDINLDHEVMNCKHTLQELEDAMYDHTYNLESYTDEWLELTKAISAMDKAISTFVTTNSSSRALEEDMRGHLGSMKTRRRTVARMVQWYTRELEYDMVNYFNELYAMKLIEEYRPKF